MKKLILTLLALALAVSMVACTQPGGPTAGTNGIPETDANGQPVDSQPGGLTNNPSNPGTQNPGSIVLTFNGNKLETSVQCGGRGGWFFPNEQR